MPADGSLLQKIIDNPRLPTLPTIAVQIIDLCRRPDASAGQIAKTISRDPALSLKVLKTVNSSYYALNHRVTTISHAMVLMGVETVKTLALGFSLMNVLKDTNGEEFDPNPIWQRSLYSAVSARVIATRMGLADPEEAFLGGLLQDLGIFALIRALGAKYIALLQQSGPAQANLVKLEQEYLSIDHTEAGATLARKWNLPATLVAPIRFHEAPEQGSGDGCPEVYAVALGNKAALLFLVEDRRAGVDDLVTCAARWIDMDPTVTMEVLETASKAMPELGKLFDISVGSAANMGELLAEANEVMAERSLQSQRAATRMRQETQQLKVRATRDALTGADNRGRFDAFLQGAFRQAVSDKKPLSLIILDMDHFKNINDTYGHQAGDRVLIALVKLMTGDCPQGGLVARYGGEEFAVVLPATAEQIAVQVAERMRSSIEKAVVEAGKDVVISFTASFGVATYDGSSSRWTVPDLIATADRALYAAKNQGRNRVCKLSLEEHLRSPADRTAPRDRRAA